MKKLVLIMSIAMGISGAAMAQRTCSTMENLDRLKKADPQIEQRMQAIEEHVQRILRENPNLANQKSTITIPVVFHVVYNTSAENISTAQVNSQVDVLQDDFNKQNSDWTNTPSEFYSRVADVGINFVLADKDPNGNSHSGITRTYTSTSSFTTNDDVKFTSRGGKDAWPSDEYLNFWVCDLGPALLGYAQFPGGPSSTDGVVCHYKYTGTVGQATTPYHLGRTATHEVGHWLNLRHIWGDSPCGNDQVSDTPTQLTSSGGCPSHPQTSCLSNDMFMNYMDYTNDACMYMFSNGQKSRMLALFNPGGHRASFASSSCNTPTGLSSSNASSSGFDISWSSVSGASSYDVQIRQQGTSTWTSYNTSSTSYSFTGLSSSTTYEYRVRTKCSASSYSSYTSIGTETTSSGSSCSTPNGIGSSNVSTTGFDVTWNSVSAATSYNIQIREQGTSTWTTNSTSSTSYSFSGLNSYTTYEYRVRSKCGGSTYSSYSSIKTETTLEVCGTPTGISTSNISTTGFKLSWSTVSNAQSYKVDIREKGTSSWTNNTTSSTSHTFSGLKDTTTYEYRVATTCNTVSSNYSSIGEETTLNDTNFCTSKGTSTTTEHIRRVQIGSIDNTSNNDGGYGDYTSLSTSEVSGSTVNFTLTPGFRPIILTIERGYPEYWRIWIDYNQDGDFDDSGELAFDAGVTSTTAVTGSFTVPTSASYGSTRMRVSMKYASAPSYCETFSNGEVEDYTFVVTAPPRFASKSGGITLFPNPANDQITIAGLKESFVQITDLSGRMVFSQKVNDPQLRVATESWKSGIYIVQVTSESGSYSQHLKFVVE